MNNLLFETPSEFAVLGLLLIAGWLFGLASAPGGGKWKRRYHDAELELARYRDEVDQELRASRARIRELEAEQRAGNARAAAAGAAGGAAVTAAASHAGDGRESPSDPESDSPASVTDEASPGTATAEAMAATDAPDAAPAVADDEQVSTAQVAEPAGPDNLARLRGIDRLRSEKLNELGIRSFGDIEKMSGEDETALEERLGVEQGTIARDEWREQAALLRAGKDEEHGSRFS